METLRKNRYDMMKDIVKCPQCNRPEYYGHLIMRDGSNYCRECIYGLWEKEGYEAAKHHEEVEAARHSRKPLLDRLSYWRRSDKDYVFPVYEDGINYFEKEEDYV